MRATPISTRRRGEYAVLQLAWPGRPLRNVGVLLRDEGADRLWVRLTGEWDSETDPDYLAALQEDIVHHSRAMGGGAFLRWCEDTLSNTLRITDAAAVEVESFTRELERLFDEHVERVAVRPYRTHLPLYSLAAAASRWGEDRTVEEEEPEDWVPVPPGVRPAEGLFVAHVVGPSMEPRIPAGSLNVFRTPVVGSRQNRILLVKTRSGFLEGVPCTVKKYTSVKRYRESGEWEHEAVVLVPLNPAFQPIHLEPDECVVLGEWVCTLE